MAVNHQSWDYVVSTQQEKDRSVRKEEVYNVHYTSPQKIQQQKTGGVHADVS